MNITATKEITKLDISGLDIPFPIRFSTTKRNDVSDTKEFWFTNGGTCKIWFGGLNLKAIGDLSQSDDSNVVDIFIDTNCDIVKATNGKYYTRASMGFSEILGFEEIMKDITKEWNTYKNDYEWRGFEHEVNEWGEIIK